jgi:hypothetical protein
MNHPHRQEILRKLARIVELSPGVRFGQLLANLGFLANDLTDRSLWDIEDDEFLAVLDRHCGDLSNRLTDGEAATATERGSQPGLPALPESSVAPGG